MLLQAVVLIVLVHNVRGQSSSPQTNISSLSKVLAQSGRTPAILQNEDIPNQTGMKEFAELFDQYHWAERLKLVEDGNCRHNMKSYITQLRNGSFWAAKSKQQYLQVHRFLTVLIMERNIKAQFPLCYAN